MDPQFGPSGAYFATFWPSNCPAPKWEAFLLNGGGCALSWLGGWLPDGQARSGCSEGMAGTPSGRPPAWRGVSKSAAAHSRHRANGEVSERTSALFFSTDMGGGKSEENITFILTVIEERYPGTPLPGQTRYIQILFL